MRVGYLVVRVKFSRFTGKAACDHLVEADSELWTDPCHTRLRTDHSYNPCQYAGQVPQDRRLGDRFLNNTSFLLALSLYNQPLLMTIFKSIPWAKNDSC